MKSAEWIAGVEAERNRAEEEFWTIVDEFGASLPSDMPEATRQLVARNRHLQTELAAAVGYLMNAKIDLETGCSKATAIKTIEGGIKRFRPTVPACTCHPDDRPSGDCPRKFAASDCQQVRSPAPRVDAGA